MVRDLAAIVERRTLSELIVDLPEATITLRRGENAPQPTMVAAPMMTSPVAQMAMPQAAAEPAAPAAAAAPVGEAPAAPDESEHVVTSPFVGTFYRRPNPDSEPYTKLGQRVDKGQILCIVEAMKLMNEIEADAAGEIVAILVEDSQPVEYGQPLFKIALAD
jgi:acetyl-CoA carboxylase biotin carboxyl carrier protein